MALIQAELAEVPSIHSYTSVEEIDRWRTARERSAVDRIVEILLRLDCHVVCRMTWICSTGLVTHVTVSKVLLSRSIDDVVAFELEQRNIVVLPNVPIDQLHRACLVTNATLQYSLESISHGTLDYSLATQSKASHSLTRALNRTCGHRITSLRQYARFRAVLHTRSSRPLLATASRTYYNWHCISLSYWERTS